MGLFSSGAIASILQVNFKYLAFKDQYYSKIKQSSSIVTLKHILGVLRNMHFAQVVFQMTFNYNVYISKS